MTTLPLADLTHYPEAVQRRTHLVKEEVYGGFCRMSLGQAEVHYCYPHTFFHEMGHAAAYLLGIEKELGLLVMQQPGAQSETNENLFCYGAQRLAVHEFDRAIAEYAADAINYYVTEPEILPTVVRDFITEHWK